MKRWLIIVLLVLLFSVPLLYASSTTDFAFMVGTGNFYNPSEGIAVSYGATLGLNKTMDLSFVCMSEIIPTAFKRNVLMLEVGMTVMGARNTGSKVSGICVNSIVSLGGFWKTENNGAGIYFGFSPLTIGAPITVKRERAFRTNIGYDFVNRKIFFTFSPLDIEIYLVGTYRDWL